MPAVQLFSGPNADYHRPWTPPRPIDAAGLVKVASVAAEAMQYLAGRPVPLPRRDRCLPPGGPGEWGNPPGEHGHRARLRLGGAGDAPGGHGRRLPGPAGGAAGRGRHPGRGWPGGDGLAGFATILKKLAPGQRVTVRYSGAGGGNGDDHGWRLDDTGRGRRQTGIRHSGHGCGTCDARLPAGARFCPACGSPVDALAAGPGDMRSLLAASEERFRNSAAALARAKEYAERLVEEAGVLIVVLDGGGSHADLQPHRRGRHRLPAPERSRPAFHRTRGALRAVPPGERRHPAGPGRVYRRGRRGSRKAVNRDAPAAGRRGGASTCRGCPVGYPARKGGR